MLKLLRRNPELRRLFAAHAVSRAGDAFNTVALIVLVFNLTGSGLGVAGVVVFEVLPVLIFGPVAGLLADRFARRTMMIAADIGRAGVALVLAAWPDSVLVAYAVAFGLSLGAIAFNPAASSLLPDVVEADDLVAANSALWTVAVVAQIVLAPVAGVIIGGFGVRIAFGLNAASFVLSACLLLRLASGRTRADIVGRGWATVVAGVATVRSHSLLRQLAVVQILASLSAGATGGLLVVLAEQRLGVGPGGFGALLAAIGLGAAIGPTLFRHLIRPARRGWLFGPYAVRGGVDLVLSSTTNAYVAGAALMAYGTSTSTGTVAYQSTIQTMVAPEVRGRAFALYDVLWSGARLISLAAGGVLVELVGVRSVYVTGAALLFVASAVGFRSDLGRES